MIQLSSAAQEEIDPNWMYMGNRNIRSCLKGLNQVEELKDFQKKSAVAIAARVPSIQRIQMTKYDFSEERLLLDDPSICPINTVGESVAYMLNVFFGGGIFATHIAFYNMGLTSSIISLVFLAIIVGISMCSLVDSAQKMCDKIQVVQLSYPDLVETVAKTSPWNKLRRLSRYVRYFVEFTLTLQLLGSCMIYHSFVALNLKQLFEGTAEGIPNTKQVLMIYILGLMIPCLMIVMVRNLKHLAPFTIAINLYASVAATITIYYGLTEGISINLAPSVKSAAGFFNFIGITLFCLDGMSISLPIENHMTDPRKFRYVVFGSLPYATSVMMIIGVFGGWSFGDKGVAPITIHFSWTHFPIMAKVFLCIIMYITYAEIFYFGFNIQWHYLKKLHSISEWWRWERFYRVINVLLITLMACVVPNVCSFMAFLGCFSVTLICFIFPACIRLVMEWNQTDLHRWLWRMATYITVIISALILLIVGSCFNLFHDVSD